MTIGHPVTDIYGGRLILLQYSSSTCIAEMTNTLAFVASWHNAANIASAGT